MGLPAKSGTSFTGPSPAGTALLNQVAPQVEQYLNPATNPYQPVIQRIAQQTPEQLAAVGNYNTAFGAANTGLSTYDQAQSLTEDAARPLTQAEIDQYFNPYVNQVVDATQRQFALQNAEQQNNLVGNAVSRGAWGGTGASVQGALAAGQQAAAEDPIIAGMLQAGYTQQEAMAAQQYQQIPLAAASALQQIGAGREGAAGNIANLGLGQYGLGTQQQSYYTPGATPSTAELNSYYAEQLARAGYPIQLTNMLAAAGSGLSGAYGSNTTTTPPPPSLISGATGLGLTGAALYGSGALGALGSMLPLAAISTGGRVQGRRAGGAVLPESPKTLHAQQRQLLDGHRRVQMFPHGSKELSLPSGMRRVEAHSGVFHYNPDKVSEAEIHKHAKTGTENHLLDLGPYSKQDIMHRVRGGEAPVAVVERHPDGTEVRAAVGTRATAAEQAAHMERTKSPGHRIHVEDVRHTLAKRADGGRVQGLQTGGIPAMPYGASPMSGLGPMPYAGGASYVPQVGPINIPKLPVAAPMAAPQDDSSKMFMDALKISKLGTDNADKNADAMQDFRMDTLGMSEASGGRVPRAYGGLAMPSSNRINVPMRGGFGMPSFMARGGLAEGGTPDDDIATAALDAAPELAASSPPIVSDVAPPVGVQVAQAAPPSGVAMDALPPEITAGASKSSAVDRLKAGIAQSETGGQRDPYGSVTSTGTGHKVYGKYQVYDDNIPIWTKQATGQAMTPAQYLASPEAQEAVASHKLGEYANKYGYAGAARAWLAGEGGMNNPNARDKFGSDPYGYSAKVMARAGLGDDAGGTQALAFDGAPAPQRGIGIATTDAGGIPGVTPIKAADLAEKTKPNKDDIWMSLLAAGLGMMGSRSPYAGVGIGQGGLQGLQTYEALHKQRVGEAEHQATLDFQAAHANQAPQMQERQFAQQKELERLRESQQTGQQGRLFEQQLQEKGYRRTPNGLEAIPGGPADPAVIEKQSIAKLSGGLMDDETAEVSARRDIKGDTSWSKNIGRGAQAGHNIVKVNEMETKILRDEYGYSPQQAAEYIANQRQAYHAEGIGMGAGARTEATREAQLGIILRATDAAIPAALEQSEKVSRTGWVPLNQIIQKGQVIASNPDLKAFGMANLQLAEHWARAMNPTGVMRETDRDKALSFLSTADSKETYKRAVGQLRTQIEREKTAVHAQKEPVPGGAAPSEAGGTSTAASAGPVKVQTPAEAAKLEPGTHYITPDGKEYTR